MTMQVQLLGPVAARVGGDPVELGGPRQRRLLGVLALNAGERVDTGRIIDAVWPDGDLPEAPRETLRTYVSRLRSSFRDADAVIGRDGGYELAVAPDCVDALQFDTLVERAVAGAPTERVGLLRAALGLWRGPALSGHEHEDWARARAAGLEERRAYAFDELAEAAIALGEQESLLADLWSAAEARPLRERTHRLLMEALARSGRRAEALRAYQAYRRRLATDLGLDPGEEIVRLERRIAAETEPVDQDGPAPPTARSYELHERIGQGSFAVVYRGTQPSVGRPVAVKKIRAELANQPAFIRRFEAEAHLVARLEHPHIVPLYDYWREPGSAYLVMRLLRGGTLEALLENGPLPVERTVAVATQIGAALAAAHRAGIVHRDLKPANVLLDELGNAYLSDFGIARDVELAHQPLDSLSIGSPAYAPPEQLRREPVTFAADIYGLAVVVFECLTGRLPFADARSEADLLRLQLDAAFPSVTTWHTDLPVGVDEVLARASAKLPTDRYASVDEFVTDLTTVLAHVDGRPADAIGVAADAPRRGAMTQVGQLDLANPYKGLRAFDEADAAVFHGRDRLVASLVERLDGEAPSARFVALVGPSGSGKSSLVRAGLVPALRRGAVAGSDDWYVATMMPGASPFEELCTALLGVAVAEQPGLVTLARSSQHGILRAVERVLGPERQLLLVIDQFEELFTQVDDENERAQFLVALGDAVAAVGSPLHVVVTLRADFYDRPLRYPSVASLFSRSTVVIAPLAPDELETAITAPAAAVGATFEPGLVATIIADVGTQPGALPLLQYALTELYDQRADTTMTSSAYRDMGGLAGAVAARAEQMYAAADERSRMAMRRLMQRLVALGDGSEDTRRRVPRSELANDPTTDAVIDAFGRARLLSFDRDAGDREPTVEVAHEALIRQWPRLREWVDEDRAGLRVHRHLTAAATAWHSGGRDSGELLRGARLTTTEEWALQHRADMNDEEGSFFEASVAARDADEAAEAERWATQARGHRRLRRLVGALAVIASVAAATSAFAVQQRSRAAEREAAATRAADAAETSRIGADAAQLVATNPRVALLLAAEAHRREPGPATLGALQRVLAHTDDLLGYLGGDRRHDAVAWLDAERVAVASEADVDIIGVDGTVERSLPITGAVVLTVDEAGNRLAVAGRDVVTIVRLDDAAAAPIRLPQSALVQTLAFGPDDVLAVGDRTGTVALYDATAGRLRRSITAHPEQNLAELHEPGGIVDALPHVPASAGRGTLDIAFDRTTGTMVTGGFGRLRWWRPSTGERLGEERLTRRLGADDIVASAYSLSTATIDGAAVFVAADPSTAWIVDPTGGRATRTVAHTDRGTFVFQPLSFVVEVTGARIISVLSETTARVLDLSRPDASHDVLHGLGEITGISLGPDERRLALSGEGGAAVFSLDGEGLISTRLPLVYESGAEVGVSVDGSTYFVGDAQARQARIVRLDGTFVPIPGMTPYALFGTPRADRLLALAADGFQLVEPVTGRRVATLENYDASHGGYPSYMANDEVLITSPAGFAQVHSLVDGTARIRIDGLPVRPDLILSTVAAPDGSHAYWSDRRGTVLRLDLMTGAVTRIDGGQIAWLAFAPDGQTLVTTGTDGTMIERHAATFQPTGRRFVVDEGERGTDVYFSADGTLLISIGGAQSQLWAWPSGQRIGDAFPSDPTFAPSTIGRWLTGGLDGQPMRWEIDVTRWPTIACRAAGRNLTPAEWEQYGPKRTPYRPTCPQYPALDDQSTTDTQGATP